MRNLLNSVDLSTLLSGVLIALSFQAVAKTTELPPILDFYPNCDYQIIKTVTLDSLLSRRGGSAKDDLLAKPTEKIFQQLKQQAQQHQADGIILLKRRVMSVKARNISLKRQLMDNGTHKVDKTKVQQLRYKAQLIKQCQDDDKALADTEKRPTPFNHKGRRTLAVTKTVVSISEMTISLPVKAKLNHPPINNYEVSLANGVYGVKLGMSYQQMIGILGSPSVELILADNELVFGYGRRHWFHFQTDKLVKVTGVSPVSVDLLNRVPLRSAFDNNDWKINNQVTFKAGLDQVYAELKISQPLNKQGELRLENRTDQLILAFELRKNMDFDESYDLGSFTLQSKTYHAKAFNSALKQQGLYTAIAQTYQQLQQNQPVEMTELRTRLGEPMGRITISTRETVEIYDPHLLLTVAGGELSQIDFVEQNFSQTDDAAKPWQLDGLVQGQDVATVTAQLPDHLVGLDDEIQVDTDSYRLTVLFDKGLSYSAELKIY